MATVRPSLSDKLVSSTDLSCGETRCNSHGSCVLPPDGGELLCDCQLGYTGDSCERTYNGALSLPLTLSILGVILFLVALAFVVAKLRRSKKKRMWRDAKAKPGYNVAWKCGQIYTAQRHAGSGDR